MSETTILLVDDHAVLRAGLHMLLDAQPGMRVVGEAGDAQEALELAGRLQPSLILLDLTLPQRDGIAALPLLRKAAPAARVLVLTMHDDVLAVAEQLGLPGFGPDGFGEGLPYTRPEHLYLKMAANLAFGEKEDGSEGVPAADDGELAIFRNARRFLPASVYDEAIWKAAIGNDENLWRQVVYLLNRGGRYAAFEKGWKGDLMANPYGKQLNLYQEKTATSINTITGAPFLGYATYIPAALAADGSPIDDAGYDFTLLTYKEIVTAKARGIADYWLLALMPENPVLMNTVDAQRLGLRTGEPVRISSASNPDGVWDLKDGTQKPMVGTLKVVEGLRPGVVTFPLGWGHYASGSRDIVVDGVAIPGDPRRATGIHANAAMRVDPVLGNVTLSDLAGGSAVFYDSKVRVERAG